LLRCQTPPAARGRGGPPGGGGERGGRGGFLPIRSIMLIMDTAYKVRLHTSKRKLHLRKETHNREFCNPCARRGASHMSKRDLYLQKETYKRGQRTLCLRTGAPHMSKRDLHLKGVKRDVFVVHTKRNVQKRPTCAQSATKSAMHVQKT